MRKITLILLGIILLPSLLLAATDEFTIKVLIDGDDVIPPSTPTLLLVNPVASSQIDVSWSVSVDNLLMGGYVLSRNGVPLATTTLTSFSDTGLVPETLYTYEVYAFDAAGNISTTSNQLATTTLALPVIAPSEPAPSNPGTATQVVALRDFKIETATNQARLNWETNFPSRYALRWGRTEAYTGGYVFSEAYRKANETTITDLEPGTSYYYELVGYLPNGIAIVLKTGQFMTQVSSLATYVPNVMRLQSSIEGEDVILRWSLPENTPIKSIRVVRSHLGFPTDINDGAIVFSGLGTTVRDPGALGVYKNQYYSVFVISEDGSVSSGAVTLVRLSAEVEIFSGEGATSVITSTSSLPSVPVIEEIPLFGLNIQAILLRQEPNEFSFASAQIELLSTLDFTISIGREALPEHLKSIIVTLLDPTDHKRSYSFLLRINKAGTAYEATIAPLQVVGASRSQVEIFDFDRQLVGRYRKPVDFVAPPTAPAPVIFPDAILATAKEAWPILVGIFVMIGFFIFLFWRREKGN